MKTWGMSMWKVISIFVVALGLFMLGTSVPAQADETWYYNFTDLDGENGIYHNTGTGGGTIFLTAHNNTGSAWSDFHFQIIDIGMGGIANVDFLSGGANGPTTTQSPFTYSIDNTSVGAKLDFFFPSDLVSNGSLATFQVSINNPDNATYGVFYKPTVVPEPISSTLFIVGAATLGVRRFMKKRMSV